MPTGRSSAASSAIGAAPPRRSRTASRRTRSIELEGLGAGVGRARRRPAGDRGGGCPRRRCRRGRGAPSRQRRSRCGRGPRPTQHSVRVRRAGRWTMPQPVASVSTGRTRANRMGARMGSLERVLIANRGEIAIRIAKAASALGMESVARLPRPSTPCRCTPGSPPMARAGRRAGTPHPTTPSRAYLDVEALVEIALATGCDCVHPGYGFLAENAAFAERCAAAGLTFVGPSAGGAGPVRRQGAGPGAGPVAGHPGRGGQRRPLGVRRRRGRARRRARLPGHAQGGGRRRRAGHAGRRRRRRAWPRRSSAAAARPRAAFGDGSLFVEKLVERPRHIEVQILADADGNVVHLHERDCSVQLRHQKVVEIAPGARPSTTRSGPRILADAVDARPRRRLRERRHRRVPRRRPRPASTSSSSATPASRSSTRSPSR